MTGIERIGQPVLPTPSKRAAGKSTFRMPPGSSASATTAAAAAPAATLGSMLTLQEFADPNAQDREARQHGQDMLAALADLQRALLLGGDDTTARQRLAELAAAIPYAADRRLAALLSSIVVRVRVELARRAR